MEHLPQFISHHWALGCALVAVLILIYINEWFSQKQAALSLSPQGVVEKINHDAAVIIDLRDQDAFSGGHIIQAIRANADDFKQPKMVKYKTKPIVLVCTKGIQAQALATQLKSQGFTSTMVLAGGLTAWQAAGLPLVKGNK